MDLAVGGGVHQIKQVGKGLAETDAASAAMANAKGPLQLLVERIGVVKIGIAPVQRMPGRCVEIAFAAAARCGGHEKTSRAQT